MATITYKCNICERNIDLLENPIGLTTFSKCVITYGCKGKLLATKRNPDNIRESFPAEVPGLEDYSQRSVLFNFNQSTPSSTWVVTHNLNTIPVISVYINNSTGALIELDVTQYSVIPLNQNQIKIKFNSTYSGNVQLISRNSIKTEITSIKNSLTLQQVTSNGTFVFAIPKFLTKFDYPPSILPPPSLPYNLASAPVRIEVSIKKPNVEEEVCTEFLLNSLVDTPWNGWGEILLRKRKNYYLFSKNILDFRTFGGDTIAFSDIPDGTQLKITRIDYGTGVLQPIESEGLFILLSNSPYTINDKIKNMIVDVGDMVDNKIDYFTYNSTDFFVDSVNVEKTYPDISKVNSSVPVMPPPLASVTPTVTPTITPASVTPLTLNFSNDSVVNYQIYACGASNNASIDWGDGTIDNIPDGAINGSDSACTNGLLHTYNVIGNYTIKIYGNYINNGTNFAGIFISATGTGTDPIVNLINWGTGNISSVTFPSGIASVPTVIPSTLTNAGYMFANATSFNQDISGWDVSNVIDMSSMFENAASFNQDISGWNVSNVKSFSRLFFNATTFNQDISGWNTSNVTDMSVMFNNATLFNQNIGGWNVSNVTNMSFMFANAIAFNQDISGWNTSNVTDMDNMFQATAYNPNIGSWNVSKVTNMSGMFNQNTAFNQNIGSWNTSNVIDMSLMFQASPFNQDISGWDVSNVTDMTSMFNNTTAFNQNIGLWNTHSVTIMNSMFQNASTFNQDLSHWCVTNIPTEPTGFNLGSSAWVLPQPVWGTCPP